MTQYRVYYAIEQFSLMQDGSASAVNAVAVHGLQSVGITTTFNLEQVFELGQLAIYENIEGIPDVEVTTEKVLDGYPPVYLLATVGAGGTGLADRQNETITGVLSLWSDSVTSAGAGGTAAQTECYMSGLYVSSLSYTFPVDGSQTESVTLVGNNKKWQAVTMGGKFAGNNDVPIASVGVARREDVVFEGTHSATDNGGGVLPSAVSSSMDACVLPTDVDGISSIGENEKSGGDFKAHIQNISVSTDLGRENLFELGRKGAYHRYVTFPVEVTTEITSIATSGDRVAALEDDANLKHQRIRIVSAEGTKIDCGDKNKLASVSMTGGDAGGDNMEITYTYTNFNDMSVNHTHADVKKTGHGIE